MATKTKRGRPSLTPQYLEAINATPKGETVVMGLVPTNEAFASFQAAAHHRDAIKLKLRRKNVGSILRVPEARSELVHDEQRGRFVETPKDGYYLVLDGRA